MTTFPWENDQDELDAIADGQFNVRCVVPHELRLIAADYDASLNTGDAISNDEDERQAAIRSRTRKRDEFLALSHAIEGAAPDCEPEALIAVLKQCRAAQDPTKQGAIIRAAIHTLEALGKQHYPQPRRNDLLRAADSLERAIGRLAIARLQRRA